MSHEMKLHFPEIGTAIASRRKELSYSRSYVHEMLAKKWNRGAVNTSDRVRNIEGGYIYGSGSAVAVRRRGDEHLRRLSIYLELLGFEESDPVIEELRKEVEDFEYPPR